MLARTILVILLVALSVYIGSYRAEANHWLHAAAQRIVHRQPKYRLIDVKRDEFRERWTFITRTGRCRAFVLDSWLSSSVPSEFDFPPVCYKQRIDIRIVHWGATRR
jgi:hypothetical protein